MKLKSFSLTGSDVLFRRISLIALMCCLCGGLLLGHQYASLADPTYFLLMRMASERPVSIMSLFTVSLLPFLISALAVYVSHPELLLPVCFCKSFLFACCAFSATSVFGTAGWLVRLLLQFSDVCLLPVLCWFWIRHIGGSFGTLQKDIFLCCGVALVVCVVDHCVISPYLVTLIDF